MEILAKSAQTFRELMAKCQDMREMFSTYHNDEYQDSEVPVIRDFPEGTGIELYQDCVDKKVFAVMQNTVVIGIVVATEKNDIFVPRAKNVPLKEFMGMVFVDILDSVERGEVEILQGEVQFLQKGLRKRLVEAGMPLVTLPSQSFQIPTFEIPAKGRRARQVTTAINKDDSFGKEIWRKRVLDYMGKIFPGGYKSIPKKERNVLCFPGLGKEAEMWKAYGFQENELHFIERDAGIAARLREKYPRANVHEVDFGTEAGTLTLNRVFFDQDGEPQREDIFAFSVINIDPENKLTGDFLQALMEIMVTCASRECLFGLNLILRRENTENLRLHHALLEKKLVRGERKAGSESYQLAMPELPYGWKLTPSRRKDLALAAIDFCKDEMGVQFGDGVPAEAGAYEGDSAKSTMYWGLSHISM